jgi:hypothetical protein
MAARRAREKMTAEDPNLFYPPLNRNYFLKCPPQSSYALGDSLTTHIPLGPKPHNDGRQANDRHMHGSNLNFDLDAR